LKQYGGLGIKLKNKSIKLNILWNFFISIVIAFAITFSMFLLVFSSIHIVSEELYIKFLNIYNGDFSAMMTTNIVGLFIFVIIAFLVFYHKMSSITNYINIITNNIHKLSQGNFSEELPIVNNNELGNLARDINIMSNKIEAYIQSEKKWNDERYNIITNMSHDLKTPIMSIDGYIQLIKYEKYANVKEFQDYCDIISRKSKELNLAINQQFELSRINASDFKINRVAIDLREFTEQVLVSYIPQFEKNNMSYRISIKQNTKINVDPALMLRVFENIITNTVKYASSGKYLEINSEDDNDFVNIEFINYGPIIEKEDLENVFNKYYREKKNSENEGNGLGLAIAKSIVELHSGSIVVTSSQEGTTFVVKLNKYM